MRRPVSLMAFLFELTVRQRRAVLLASVLVVLLIGYVNHLAEEALNVEVEALYLAPIAAVAWACSRRCAVAFASFVAVVATASCVINQGFPPLQTTVELVVHAGTFVSAALIVNLLASVMNRQVHCAHFDGLTEAVNAAYFREFVQRELARASRHGHSVAVAFLDLDDFKRLNDEMGHSVGDRALQFSVALMKEQVRVTDVVGRLGGDEFGILMPETDEAEAGAVLERLRVAIKERASEKGWPISASIGAVTVSGGSGDATPETIIKRADAVMYRVKSTSKDRVLIEHFA